MSINPEGCKFLVSGASGYIGGRLVRALLDDGLDVRIFLRNSAKIQGQPWASRVEIVEGNANNEPILTKPSREYIPLITCCIP